MRRADAQIAAIAFVVGLASSTLGCKGPMAKIEALRDALVSDDAEAIRNATSGYPSCDPSLPPVAVAPNKPGPRDAGCLSEIANALGSKKGFVPSPPDHASASAAALVIVRDGRGDWLAHADTWLADLKSGSGIGHDVLRLAIARRMSEAAPSVGRKIEDDASANAALRAIAGAIPGACPTYWLVSSGEADAKTIPAELTPDHSACVQKDLARREGPGGRYGSGTLRALEGSLALWRETERALRLGLPNAAPGPKAVLEKKLATIEAATRKIETKKLEPQAPDDVLNIMGDLHAEAGVPILKPRDAGTDAPTPTPPPR